MTWSKAGLASLGLPPKSCETCTGKDLYILQTTEALMDDTDDSSVKRNLLTGRKIKSISV